MKSIILAIAILFLVNTRVSLRKKNKLKSIFGCLTTKDIEIGDFKVKQYKKQTRDPRDPKKISISKTIPGLEFVIKAKKDITIQSCEWTYVDTSGVTINSTQIDLKQNQEYTYQFTNIDLEATWGVKIKYFTKDGPDEFCKIKPSRFP